MANQIRTITRPSEQKDLQKELQNLQLIEQIKHGNIYEVFSKVKGFKIADFQDYFRNRWHEYKSSIIQDLEVVKPEASMQEPQLEYIGVHHREAKIERGEMLSVTSDLANFLKQSSKFKAGSIDETGAEGTGDAAASPETPLTEDELVATAEGTLGEWDQFLSDTWSQIMDAQMMRDYQTRMGEIQKEVDRIIALVKSGAAGPEFALLALAKVNQTKNGVLMTHLGKKAFAVNEAMSNISNDIHAMDPTDPRFASEVQLASSKTRDGGFQLNLLVTDMQKIMQDVASVMESIHSMISEMNRSRREIVTRFAAQ